MEDELDVLDDEVSLDDEELLDEEEESLEDEELLEDELLEDELLEDEESLDELLDDEELLEDEESLDEVLDELLDEEVSELEVEDGAVGVTVSLQPAIRAAANRARAATGVSNFRWRKLMSEVLVTQSVGGNHTVVEMRREGKLENECQERLVVSIRRRGARQFVRCIAVRSTTRGSCASRTTACRPCPLP